MKHVTHKNLEKVWAKLMAYAVTDDERQEVAAVLDDILDELVSNDFFGTEGQCDPRGDQRS